MSFVRKDVMQPFVSEGSSRQGADPAAAGLAAAGHHHQLPGSKGVGVRSLSILQAFVACACLEHLKVALKGAVITYKELGGEGAHPPGLVYMTTKGSRGRPGPLGSAWHLMLALLGSCAVGVLIGLVSARSCRLGSERFQEFTHKNLQVLLVFRI